ncbi:MAG TPA: TldD/PmbA family protein [Candidatus Coprenecus stercoravium]|uniref:TldD/PmbA family protein n=1 Tax=Candidatus Coprenecus stercoravium TaxID=2840735 RepID=A0A9D2GQ41_9BACT|nr:TldD/PmbA family protein [Candidatus Coprenecus stercoravium]
MNKDIARQALDTALALGASDCRISLSESEQTSISYLNGEIEKLQESSSASMRVTLFTDGRFGIFSTNRMNAEELRPFLSRCIESCRLLTPDECRTMPDPSLYYRGGLPDLQQTDPHFSDIAFKDKTDILKATDAEVDKSDPRLISTACDWDDCRRSDYIIDSQGLEAEAGGTFYSVSCECTVKGHGEARPQNNWYEGSIFFDRLPSGCGRKAYERTVPMIDSRKLPSGKYNIVLENTVSARAVSAVIAALNGSALQQRNSFLLDSLGKQLFPDSLHIADNPLIPGRTGSGYFDSEGVATMERDIIRNGQVCTYFLNTYFANKLGMPRTAEDAFAVYFPKNSGIGQEEILRQTGNGVLITGFNGGNSNPVTGDFSYGIEGWYFENGQRLYPVKEMNLTGNFLSLWKNSIFIGNDPIGFMEWQIPTLAFEGADISGL